MISSTCPRISHLLTYKTWLIGFLAAFILQTARAETQQQCIARTLAGETTPAETLPKIPEPKFELGGHLTHEVRDFAKQHAGNQALELEVTRRLVASEAQYKTLKARFDQAKAENVSPDQLRAMLLEQTKPSQEAQYWSEMRQEMRPDVVSDALFHVPRYNAKDPSLSAVFYGRKNSGNASLEKAVESELRFADEKLAGAKRYLDENSKNLSKTEEQGVRKWIEDLSRERQHWGGMLFGVRMKPIGPTPEVPLYDASKPITRTAVGFGKAHAGDATLEAQVELKLNEAVKKVRTSEARQAAARERGAGDEEIAKMVTEDQQPLAMETQYYTEILKALRNPDNPAYRRIPASP